MDLFPLFLSFCVPKGHCNWKYSGFVKLYKWKHSSLIPIRHALNTLSTLRKCIVLCSIHHKRTVAFYSIPSTTVSLNLVRYWKRTPLKDVRHINKGHIESFCTLFTKAPIILTKDENQSDFVCRRRSVHKGMWNFLYAHHTCIV